ncbi:MAG TPA: hypothetical protein PKD47_08200, partial [Solirubrobacterales bacterium]|nr:hypothetical protein [Solirubrobacterales bacterium]
MKARLGDPGKGVAWNFEVKWDGYRAIAFCSGGLKLQGRRLNEIGADFPEIKPLGSDSRARGLVLDGELVVVDEDGRPDFQLMQSRRERQLEAHFMIFDLLWADGTDLRPMPYLERRARLPAPDDVVEALGEALVDAREIVELGALREGDHVGDLLVGEVQELARPRTSDLGDDEISEMTQEVARGVRDVEALLGHAVDHLERGERLALHE